jgi:UDP-2-acetamido-3-amino-2,3-dideoxy-glucuronate N-acetyltransferase
MSKLAQELIQTPEGYFYHESAYVDEGSEIGEGTKIWHFSHVCPGAKIGRNCVIGQGCYIGPGVVIGDNCKVQNGNSLYEGIVLEDGAFIGPHCAFTNDRNPVAVDTRTKEEWLEHTLLKKNCALGAGTVVRCGITIGEGARTGAGTLVVKDIPDGELWVSKALPAEPMLTS